MKISSNKNRLIKVCSYCKHRFLARLQKQTCCEKPECHRAWHNEWQKRRFHHLYDKDSHLPIICLWTLAVGQLQSRLSKSLVKMDSKSWQYRICLIRCKHKMRGQEGVTSIRVYPRLRSGWTAAFRVICICICNAISYRKNSDVENMIHNIKKSIQTQTLNRHMAKDIKTISVGYIRGLLIAQDGKCAISGRTLTPHEVNVDHIVPLSRCELFPSISEQNIWLVHKKINQMKGAMTYEELIECCQLVLNNKKVAKALLHRIKAGGIKEISKRDFDSWAEEH